MSSKERPIIATETSQPVERREQAVERVMEALRARRQAFFESNNPLATYLKTRYGDGVVEMTPERERALRRRAERLVDTLATGRSPSGKPISELSPRYQRDLRLAALVTNLLDGVREVGAESGSESPTVPEAESNSFTEIPTPESRRKGWQELRERFGLRLSLKRMGERLRASVGPLSPEEIEAVLEKQKARAEAKKRWVRVALKRINALVSQVWAEFFGPLTPEEINAALRAQEFRMPQLEFWKGHKDKGRIIAILAVIIFVGGEARAVLASGGTTGVYEEKRQTPAVTVFPRPLVPSPPFISPGMEEAIKELQGGGGEGETFGGEEGTFFGEEEVPFEEEVPPGVFSPTTPPSPATPTPPPTSPTTVTPQGPVEGGEELELLGPQARRAIALEAKRSQATAQVRKMIEEGVEIVQGSHPWGAAEIAAQKIMEAAGVGPNSNVKLIVTDAIKDAAGLPGLVTPGTRLPVRPHAVAEGLKRTIRIVREVTARGGAEGLRVKVSEGDLKALEQIVEFLGGF